MVVYYNDYISFFNLLDDLKEKDFKIKLFAESNLLKPTMTFVDEDFNRKSFKVVAFTCIGTFRYDEIINLAEKEKIKDIEERLLDKKAIPSKITESKIIVLQKKDS